MTMDPALVNDSFCTVQVTSNFKQGEATLSERAMHKCILFGDKNSVCIVAETYTFFATITDDHDVPSDDIIIWDTASINSGGYFNTTDGGFTAPVHGYYQ